jgi:Fatty acid cis/trans isomerase (CTI)
MSSKHTLISLFILILSGCATFSAINFESLYGPSQPRERVVAKLEADQIDYWREVKPILEKRCVVCHGCYDAPCQAKLSSIEGIERGASAENVYATRLRPGELTRLHEDAHSVDEWRDKAFFPVLNEHVNEPEANRQASLIYQLLELKEAHPLPQTDILPDDFTLGLNREETCAKIEDVQHFANKHPLWGMPYALPGLESEEQDVLKSWVEQGAIYTPRPPLDSAYVSLIEEWESFLNRDSLKGQLVSRYIYEHLFLGHLFFDEIKPIKYFKLVRSASPPGQPVERISTRRPYDDPDVDRVYYRFVEKKESIVVKTHMPYVLNNDRMKRWQQLFFAVPYEVTSLPDYQPHVSANPFDSFQQLPVDSRYRFMLDEAHYIIQGFIKGPVCRGQVALNVIKDHFWIFFANPERGQDKNKALSEFLIDHKQQLEMPTAKGDIYLPLTNWQIYAKKERELLAARDAFLTENLDASKGITLDLIWDGDGHNDNAALTVFRHFDSASVHKGMVGPAPQTAWLIGYTLLERIHYLLVAGYDVYGNVGHELLTRIYMDFLRMEGESNFLQLLPETARNHERERWYRGADAELKAYLTNPSFEQKSIPAIPYQTQDEKQELFTFIGKKLKPVLSTQLELATLNNPVLEKQLARLATFSGANTALLPETMFVAINNSGKQQPVTIIHNTAHLSITSMFEEHKELIPEEDTITVANGFVGSYPNVLVRIDQSELGEFVDKVMALKTQADYAQLLNRFGVRRTSPEFWAHVDKINETSKRDNPIEAGIFDFNRLENR